jgi:molybdopterin-guanine dinucleotide biosynthesis protein A
MSREIAVVILAGGEGRRIGGAKPLRTLAGERLIDRALRLARGWSDIVAVAVRDPAQVEPLDAILVEDDQTVPGPLGGLITALRFAQQAERPLLLTVPADMPFLPPDLLERLAEALGTQGCALAASSGHLHPVCGLWRASALDRLPAYLSSERRSLKGLGEAVGMVSVEWPGGAHGPFLNINTAEDLAAAERRAAL